MVGAGRLGSGVSGVGVGVDSAVTRTLAPEAPVMTFVPSPSSANTLPPLIPIVAVPTAWAVNVMRMIVPALPLYPGCGSPPMRLTTPLDPARGSRAQKLKMEPLFETLVSFKMLLVYEIVASAALIGWPPAFTRTLTVTVLPTVVEDEEGETDNVAADACVAPAKTPSATMAMLMILWWDIGLCWWGWNRRCAENLLRLPQFVEFAL